MPARRPLPSLTRAILSRIADFLIEDNKKADHALGVVCSRVGNIMFLTLARHLAWSYFNFVVSWPGNAISTTQFEIQHGKKMLERPDLGYYVRTLDICGYNTTCDVWGQPCNAVVAKLMSIVYPVRKIIAFGHYFQYARNALTVYQDVGDCSSVREIEMQESCTCHTGGLMGGPIPVPGITDLELARFTGLKKFTLLSNTPVFLWKTPRGGAPALTPPLTELHLEQLSFRYLDIFLGLSEHLEQLHLSYRPHKSAAKNFFLDCLIKSNSMFGCPSLPIKEALLPEVYVLPRPLAKLTSLVINYAGLDKKVLDKAEDLEWEETHVHGQNLRVVPHEAIVSLISQCPNLRHLELQFATSDVLWPPQALVNALPRSLEELLWQGCLTEPLFSSLLPWVSTSPNLKQLFISAGNITQRHPPTAPLLQRGSAACRLLATGCIQRGIQGIFYFRPGRI